MYTSYPTTVLTLKVPTHAQTFMQICLDRPSLRKPVSNKFCLRLIRHVCVNSSVGFGCSSEHVYNQGRPTSRFCCSIKSKKKKLDRKRLKVVKTMAFIERPVFSYKICLQSYSWSLRTDEEISSNPVTSCTSH